MPSISRSKRVRSYDAYRSCAVTPFRATRPQQSMGMSGVVNMLSILPASDRLASRSGVTADVGLVDDQLTRHDLAANHVRPSSPQLRA